MTTKKLMTLLILGPYITRNRVVMAPLTRTRAGDRNVPREMKHCVLEAACKRRPYHHRGNSSLSLWTWILGYTRYLYGIFGRITHCSFEGRRDTGLVATPAWHCRRKCPLKAGYCFRCCGHRLSPWIVLRR